MKIKGLMSLIAMMALVLPIGAQAVDRSKPRVEFKCHFVLADGNQTVRYLTGNTNKVREFRQSLGSSLYAKDGTTKLGVKEVTECVKADKEFRGFEARQVDKKTLS